MLSVRVFLDSVSSWFGVIRLSLLGSAAAALSGTLSGLVQQYQRRPEHEGKDGSNWPAESSGAYGPYFSPATRRY